MHRPRHKRANTPTHMLACKHAHTNAYMQTHKNMHKYTDSSHKNTHKYTDSANLTLYPSSTSFHTQVENGGTKKTVLTVYTSSRKCAHQRKGEHIETLRRVLRCRHARPDSFACPLCGKLIHACHMFIRVRTRLCIFRFLLLKQAKGGGGRKDGNPSTKREKINERRGRRS